MMQRTLADRGAKIIVELQKAETANLKDGIRIARKWSSGGVSTAQLADMDHPFATRHAAPSLPPELLNTQDAGGLITQWKSQGPKVTDGSMVSAVFNPVPYGKYLVTGTKWMVPRPILDEIKKELMPIVIKRRREALKRGLR